MRSPRTPSGRGANQVRCKTCHRFLHLWNKHEECVPCSVKSGRTCAPDKTCVICAAWPDDQWALYNHAIRDAQRAPSHPPARRSLQRSGTSVADFRTPAWTGPPPAWTGPPAGPTGSAPGSYWYPSSQPTTSPWGPPSWPDPAGYRAFLLQQLATTQPGPPQPEFWQGADLLQGAKDAELLSLPPGQRSRSPRSSRGSSAELLGFTPLNLDRSRESAGASPPGTPGRGRRRGSQSPDSTPSHRRSRRDHTRRSVRASLQGSPTKTTMGECGSQTPLLL